MTTLLERITLARRKEESAKSKYQINIIPGLVADSLDLVKITKRINFWITRDVKFARENRVCLFCGSGKKSVKGNNACRKCGNGNPMPRKIYNSDPALHSSVNVSDRNKT